MASIPVNQETLGSKRLKPIATFSHLSALPACEILAGEFATTATAFPIFFIDTPNGISPVALFSLQDKDNLFVEQDGRWGGAYMPATLRSHPFTVEIVQADGESRPQLMVDEQMLSDEVGEPLFGVDEQGNTAGPVARVVGLFAEMDRQSRPTRDLVAQIAEAGLLHGITVSGDGQQSLGGLHAVNEAKLQELPDDKFLELRRSGALNLIYAHMVSLAQLNHLQARFAARAKN